MMKIAFLISAHTDPSHLRRLINSLPDEAEYFVHVDAKTSIIPFKALLDDSRVHFTQQRINIMWGSFGQVEYQMTLIKEALESSTHFDYLISISGLDYPIWKNSQILQELEKNKGKEYLFATCISGKSSNTTKLYREYRLLNTYPWKYGTLKSKFRVSLRYLLNALGIKKKLVIPCNGKLFKIYKGGSWWGITSELAKYVLNVYESEPKFVKYFKTAFGPDETFVHTIACNSSFAAECTILDKEPIILEELSPLTYIEYGNEIKIFTEDDFNTIIKSGKMFCRKTITGKSDRLLDMIDKYRKE